MELYQTFFNAQETPPHGLAEFRHSIRKAHDAKPIFFKLALREKSQKYFSQQWPILTARFCVFHYNIFLHYYDAVLRVF